MAAPATLPVTASALPQVWALVPAQQTLFVLPLLPLVPLAGIAIVAGSLPEQRSLWRSALCGGMAALAFCAGSCGPILGLFSQGAPLPAFGAGCAGGVLTWLFLLLRERWLVGREYD